MTDNEQQDNTPQYKRERLAKVQRAIDEIRERKSSLTDETYHQVIAALYSQRRRLQTGRYADETGDVDKELRLLTVMFIDIADSTRLAVKLGDENFMGVMIGLHNRLSHIIQRWDGEIAQYLGDGILCYFGVRRSQGNDATRAVACALEIQSEIAEYDAVVRQQHPSVERFAGRIGIATGTAMVGLVGEGGKMAIFAIGRLAALANRLQDQAVVGGVAIDTETQLRARSDFDLEAQPARILKGFEAEEQQTFYFVMGQKNRLLTTFTTDQIAGIPMPMEGRAEIFATLLEMLRNVSERGGFQAATLYGVAGIGKSRLLQKVAHSELAGRFKLLRMVGHYERTQTAYSLLRDMIASVCEITPNLEPAEAEWRIKHYTENNWYGRPEQAQSAAEIVGYLAGFGFAHTAAVQSFHRSQVEHDQGVYHWVKLWMHGVAGDQPILLMVDNLHWADAQSVKLLNALHESGSPMALFAAARPEFAADLAAAGYMASALHAAYHLSPLDDLETRVIIHTVLKAVDEVPGDLIDMIVERAEGNPLFVDQFLRMLFDTGVFEPTDAEGRWRTNRIQYSSVKDTLPSGLQGVFQARLDDLPPVSKRVVQLGSVVGQPFWQSAVKLLANTTDDDQLTATLDDLIDRGILLRLSKSALADDVEYTFRNTLYHEVAYKMLPREYRVDYHNQTAEWLAERTSERPEMLGLLAEHYKHAERPLDALRTYAEAAMRQVERNALPETKKLIESGLASMQTVPRKDALPHASRLWLAQARAAHAQRRYGEATAAGETALRLLNELPSDRFLAERVQASVTLANAHISLGNFIWANDSLERARLLLHGVNGPGYTGMMAVLMRAFGYLYWSQGKLALARDHELDAIHYAETDGDPRETAATQSLMGRICLDEGRFSDMLKYMEHVLEINRSVGTVVYQIADLYLIALGYYLLFQYETALSLLEEAEEISSSVDFDMPFLAACRGMCYLGLGERQEEALTLIEDATNRGKVTASDRRTLRLFGLRALVEVGYYDVALAEGKAFLDDVSGVNDVLYGRGLLWVGLAQHALDMPEAHDTLLEALDMERQNGGRDLWLCEYAYSLTLADAGAAKALREEADYALESVIATMPLDDPADGTQRLRALFARWPAVATTH